MRILCLLLIVLPGPLWAQSRSFVDHVDHVKNCVYRVETSGGQFLGTAFTINAYGDLLTCLHVVEPKGRRFDSLFLRSVVSVVAGAVTEERNLRSAAAVKIRIPQFDAAILHMDTMVQASSKVTEFWRFAFMPFAPSSSLREGEEVALCAFIPDDFTSPRPFVAKGIISTVRGRVFVPDLKNEVELVQLDLSAARGTSGGPIFLISSGRVVGIQDMGIFQSNEASQTLYPIALGISQIVPILDSLRIPYDAE